MCWVFEKKCNIFEKFWRGWRIFKVINTKYQENFKEIKTFLRILCEVWKIFHDTWKYFNMHLGGLRKNFHKIFRKFWGTLETTIRYFK